MFFEAHGYRGTLMFWNPFQTKTLNIEVILSKKTSFKSFRAFCSSFGILPVQAQKKNKKTSKNVFNEKAPRAKTVFFSTSKNNQNLNCFN